MFRGGQNAPGPGHGEEGFDVIVGVHGQDGDRVAGCKPQRLECRCRPGNALAKLLPGSFPAGAEGGGVLAA